jgi:hypothetical protein
MVDGEAVLDLGDDAVIRILHDRVVAALTPRRVLLGDVLAEV